MKENETCPECAAPTWLRAYRVDEAFWYECEECGWEGEPW